MIPIMGIDLGGTKIEGVILESMTTPPLLYAPVDTESAKVMNTSWADSQAGSQYEEQSGL